MAFSRDSRTLATGSNDRTVILWDEADRSGPIRLGRLAGHTKAVESVAFSRDGRTVASGGDDNDGDLVEYGDRADPVQLGQPLTGPHGGRFIRWRSPQMAGHWPAAAGTAA